ncbi:MAG: hypothetical protein ACRENO_00935 [Thermodesulfobacteriota bacterium]
MKSTQIKISVSQDGLLPQESVNVATIEFPLLPKKLLKALGFERVDNTTFVGVMPVFVNLGEKEQEIEIELGVSMPEMRNKILELFEQSYPSPVEDTPSPKEKKSTKSTKKTVEKKENKTAKPAVKSPRTPKFLKTDKVSSKKTALSKRSASKKTKG